jgi:hypothetical protein
LFYISRDDANLASWSLVAARFGYHMVIPFKPLVCTTSHRFKERRVMEGWEREEERKKTRSHTRG